MTQSCCRTPLFVEVSAKCSDMCVLSAYDKDGELVEHNGYVPDGLGIGKGDYVYFDYCSNCGKIAGKWPMKADDVVDILRGEK